MIFKRDFADLEELRDFCETGVQVINIESIPYRDKDAYYYRVWFKR